MERRRSGKPSRRFADTGLRLSFQAPGARALTQSMRLYSSARDACTSWSVHTTPRKCRRRHYAYVRMARGARSSHPFVTSKGGSHGTSVWHSNSTERNGPVEAGIRSGIPGAPDEHESQRSVCRDERPVADPRRGAGRVCVRPRLGVSAEAHKRLRRSRRRQRGGTGVDGVRAPAARRAARLGHLGAAEPPATSVWSCRSASLG